MKKCLKWIWYGRNEIKLEDYKVGIDLCEITKWFISFMNKPLNTIEINIINGYKQLKNTR